MALTEKLNRDWFEERLARAPGWYLVLYLVMNVGVSTTWLVLNLKSGHTAWAVFFGVLSGIAVAIVFWAVLVKRRRRREAEEFAGQLPNTTPSARKTR